MSDKVLVGVLPGDPRPHVLKWAALHARGRQRTIELVSIIGGAVGAVGEQSLVVEAEEHARTALEAQRDALVAEGFSVTVHVGHGNPVSGLIEASKDAAMLVIGSDFRGEGHGPVRGPHGIRIVSGAHCPVVVVREPDERERRGVVVGVDGSEISEKAIAFAAAEADRLGEPLIGVTTWAPMEVPRSPGLYPSEYLHSLAALADEASAISLAGLAQTYPDLVVERRVEQGYPGEAIVDAAWHAHLTVVGSHGRGVIARFLLGSVSEELLMRLPSSAAIVR
ncbi:universal stress protein [Microbacterium thalassium]|uniref:Nucleotide-binding universal stress UspA family protein n=1 Tax=Microbacterium thalassium TaxID=362649 RepID=A0A7X0FP09_9MICO|nr:universal stress protein [Microbacterium thalassium]MBB6391044.1 nucleotide-binding universal stress UspA family protein [Microbacterium thalassium]GLK24785.1 universal stress protein [Microbacterium thalassium]